MEFMATYRLQLHHEFDFHAANHVLPYLKELGVNILYLSPIFEATPGSLHGYDQTAPDQISRSLQKNLTFQNFIQNSQKMGFKIILDIVPNHMVTHHQNIWWQDVLLNGDDSIYAQYFDIDWERVAKNNFKILLPVLGSDLEIVLLNDELKIEKNGNKYFFNYNDQIFPISNYDSNLNIRELLGRQYYELSYWKNSLTELHYRRFFDITSLIGTRMDLDEVFYNTHNFILELLHKKNIHGLRIDHIDGLRNPTAYLKKLEQEIKKLNLSFKPIRLVEKILEGNETLPLEWPIDGTTGYEFMNIMNDIFIQEQGELLLREDFSDLDAALHLYNTKIEIIDLIFTPEFNRLTNLLNRVVSDEINIRIEVLKKITASLDVYRTYLHEDINQQASIQVLERAFNTLITYEKLSEIQFKILLWWMDFLKSNDHDKNEISFIALWQQVSGAVMAKGYEDTFLYRFYPLSSRNEVGSMIIYPVHNSISNFHQFLMSKVENFPKSLNATSTHDNKRSEDTRARINVLSEISDEWLEWKSFYTEEMESFGISNNVLNLLAQSIYGTWNDPKSSEELTEFKERIYNYLTKANREGKEVSSWLQPDVIFEEKLEKAINFFLSPECKSFQSLQVLIKQSLIFGRMNSLSQVILKIFAPGIVDFYQGSELWDDSLVDPDNRRKVNYESRSYMVQQIISEQKQNSKLELLKDLMLNWENGKIKLHLIWLLLNLRKDIDKDLAHTTYRSLTFEGKFSDCLIGYEIKGSNLKLIIVASRFFKKFNFEPSVYDSGIWSDTWIKKPPQEALYEVLSSRSLVGNSLKEILKVTPFAVLKLSS